MPGFSLTGGLVFAGSKASQQDIHIDAEGKLVALGSAPAEFKADEVVDVSGKWLVINLTDISARLTLPHRELAESLRQELNAVERAGITQVLMKPHSDHFVDHSDHVRRLRRLCAGHAPRVIICASLYRRDADNQSANQHAHRRFIDFHSFRAAGCREIDIPARTRYSTRDIEKAMIVAESLDMRLNLTPLDPDLAGTGCCHQGALSARLGLDGIGVSAESVSMLVHLEIAASTGCRLHLSEISSARAVEILARARQDNPRISADVGITQLRHSVNDLADYRGALHTIPPIRDDSDRRELLAAVNAGVIECISSAHTPLSSSDKCNPFPGVGPGMSTIDSFVPQVLNLVNENLLEAEAAIAAISSRPNAILRNTELSTPVPGAMVDITVIDKTHSGTTDSTEIHSAGKNCLPIDSHGRVEVIYLGGRRIG